MGDKKPLEKSKYQSQPNRLRTLSQFESGKKPLPSSNVSNREKEESKKMTTDASFVRPFDNLRTNSSVINDSGLVKNKMPILATLKEFESANHHPFQNASETSDSNSNSIDD